MRRAPDEYFINAIVNAQMLKYMADNNLNFSGLIDKLEDMAEEAELAKEEAEQNQS